MCNTLITLKSKCKIMTVTKHRNVIWAAHSTALPFADVIFLKLLPALMKAFPFLITFSGSRNRRTRRAAMMLNLQDIAHRPHLLLMS